MKRLLWGLLLVPIAASAQLYDFSDTLTGTETVYSDTTSGPPTESITDVSLPVTGFVDITNLGPETFGFTSSVFDLSGPTGGSGGATGLNVNWTLGDNPGEGATVNITANSATFTTASGCESAECVTYNLAGGAGTWVDPPSYTNVSAAPEISASGALAGLTLLAGLVLLARARV